MTMRGVITKLVEQWTQDILKKTNLAILTLKKLFVYLIK